jgi:hypothetical protein
MEKLNVTTLMNLLSTFEYAFFQENDIKILCCLEKDLGSILNNMMATKILNPWLSVWHNGEIYNE